MQTYFTRHLSAFFIVATTGILATQCMAEDTLIDLDNARVGGFAGPVFKAGSIKGDETFELGVMGGATFTTDKHSIMIGGAGYGLVNELDWSPTEQLEVGYGGIVFGYTYNPEALIHVDSSVLFGAGGVAIVNPNDSTESDTGSFLVSELTAMVEVNVTEFMEVGVGGAYRFASDPNIDGLSASDLSGPSFVISFQFGSL